MAVQAIVVISHVRSACWTSSTVAEFCDQRSKFRSVSAHSLSQSAVEAEVGSKAELLPLDRLDISPVPGSSRFTILQPRLGSAEQSPLPLGPPRETLESILLALDTEKSVLEPVFREMVRITCG